MYIFKIHGNEYKVRFTYRTVCEDDILDKIMKITDPDDKTFKGLLSNLVRTTAELLLVGLQKYHSKEFGYDTEEEKQKRIEEMLDLFDDYEDESTEEHPQSAASLLTDLQDELEKNGFLSQIAQMGEQMEKVEKTAEETMTQMENESARTRVIDMTPTESKS